MWAACRGLKSVFLEAETMMAVGGVEKCVLGTFPCHPQPPAVDE
jgi:hypothetical protein